jgi:hypothetical protein
MSEPILLSDHADLMRLLHPDYPTKVGAIDSSYEDHLLRVAAFVIDARAQEANLIANLIAKEAPYNMELNHDGTEDKNAAAYVQGVQAGHDVARTRYNELERGSSDHD